MSLITDAIKAGPLWGTLPGRLRAQALVRPERVRCVERQIIRCPSAHHLKLYWESAMCASHTCTGCASALERVTTSLS